jgi:hypothetical protein
MRRLKRFVLALIAALWTVLRYDLYQCRFVKGPKHEAGEDRDTSV